MEGSKEISDISSKNGRLFRLSFEVALALYSSSLLAFIYESKPPYAWDAPRRYLYFWHPHAVTLNRTDFALFYAELFLLPALVIFVCLRLAERTSVARFLLRAVGGALAVVGLPLVCLYGSDRLLSFALLEPVIATSCLLLWAYRKWPLSAPVTIFLLIIHYTFWSFFCVSAMGMSRFGKPVAGWNLWDYMVILYPVLGFSYSLIWAAYFRPSHAEELDPMIKS